MQKYSWILLALFTSSAGARELDKVARILTVPLGGATRDVDQGHGVGGPADRREKAIAEPAGAPGRLSSRTRS